MLEIILTVLGLTVGYFLIKEAVRKGILEAHEEMGDYRAPITKAEKKQPDRQERKQPDRQREKASAKTETTGSRSTVINNWICPHCDAINTSENYRCIKCGKLPTESVSLRR